MVLLTLYTVIVTAFVFVFVFVILIVVAIVVVVVTVGLVVISFRCYVLTKMLSVSFTSTHLALYI